MVLAVSSLNGVKVYNLSAGKTLPEWLESTNTAKERSLRYNQDFRRRLELIQDFTFPTASSHVAMSRDGRYIVAAGNYRPQVKVFELDQLGLKFERHIDSDVVAMHTLSEDYSKLALLRADRTVELHARYGQLYTIRIPRFGRDMAYNSHNCDLMVAGSGSEVWRLNLEQGQFLGGFQTDLADVNVIRVNPVHHLIGMGGPAATIECWDPRDRTRAASLCIGDEYLECTAMHFADDGLTMAVGTETGHCLLFDLRSSRPVLVKDHRYGLSIRDVQIHERTRNVVSTDGKIVKLWDRATGDPFTSIQPDCPVHRLCLVQGTGMLFAAGDQHRIPTYYVPELGPAPKWCSFLDNLTEELEEETRTTTFDDYKFVTAAELSSLGLDHLIGSNLLRAYMHGYFMDIRLWKKVKAVADPFEYENFIKQRVQDRISAQRAERITVKRKAPKVNKEYAEALTTGKSGGDTLLKDERFASLFKDSEFAIDKESDEFVRLLPTNAKLAGAAASDDRFTMVDESDDGNSEEEVGVPSDVGSGSSDSDDLFAPDSKKRRVRASKPRKKKAMYALKQSGGELPLSAPSAPGVALPKSLKKKPMAERARELSLAKAAAAASRNDAGARPKPRPNPAADHRNRRPAQF